MDWGAALSGVDQELSHIMARNKMRNDSELGMINQIQTIRNQGRAADRLEAAQRAQENYYNDQISVETKDLEAKARKADLAEQERTEMEAAVNDYMMETDPQLKAAKGANLLKYKIKVQGQGVGKPILVIGRNGKVVNKIDAPEGTSTVMLPAPPSVQGTTSMPLTPEAMAMIIRMGKAGDVQGATALGAPSRGAAGLAQRAKILNAIAAETGDEFNPTAEFADLQSRKKSLDTMTKAYNAQSGFHKAVVKNFDVVAQRMAKIPDVGIPELNRPLREIKSAYFGDKDVLAFEVARRSVVREYQRLVESSPMNLSGVLHASSQAAFEKLLSEDATLPQLWEAMQVMKQDMDNVLSATKSQMESLQGEIRSDKTQPAAAGGDGHGGGAAAPGAPPKGAKIKRFNPATGAFEEVKQ